MTSRVRSLVLSAGIFGLTGVALGAFGAHALAATLAEKGTTHAWETASRYHLLHTVVLFGAAGWLKTASGAAANRIFWAARCWSIGILLFSGSLYGIALGGPRWLGPVTPLGGVALMAGWLLVIAAAFASED
jgi:uncharacterized membrane protein YgdD (TMEM256/DUF423 family)